jgi:hypothetical protein
LVRVSFDLNCAVALNANATCLNANARGWTRFASGTGASVGGDWPARSPAAENVLAACELDTVSRSGGDVDLARGRSDRFFLPLLCPPLWWGEEEEGDGCVSPAVLPFRNGRNEGAMSPAGEPLPLPAGRTAPLVALGEAVASPSGGSRRGVISSRRALPSRLGASVAARARATLVGVPAMEFINSILRLSLHEMRCQSYGRHAT